jgi:hypothetical protein
MGIDFVQCPNQPCFFEPLFPINLKLFFVTTRFFGLLLAPESIFWLLDGSANLLTKKVLLIGEGINNNASFFVLCERFSILIVYFLYVLMIDLEATLKA